MLKKTAIKKISYLLKGKISAEELTEIENNLAYDNYDFLIKITDEKELEENLCLLNQVFTDCNGIRPSRLEKRVYQIGYKIYGKELHFGNRFIDLHFYEGCSKPKRIDKVINDCECDYTQIYIFQISTVMPSKQYDFPKILKNILYVYIPQSQS